ncbi:MAG: CAP domain-containing protein [Chitinophagales bacterium]
MYRKNFHSLVLLLYVWIPHALFSQQANDTINAQQFNAAFAEKVFLEEVNRFRNSSGIDPLISDEALQKSANDQAQYCRYNNKLTYTQERNTEKADAVKRARYFKSNAFLIGESNAMVFVRQPFTHPVTHAPTTIETYKQLAQYLFSIWWKNKNDNGPIADGTYVSTGLGFSFSDNGHLLFVVQSLGSASYKPMKNRLVYSDTTFGIHDYSGRCKVPDDNNFLAHILSNYLVRRDDSLFIYYMAEQRFKRLIQRPNDGIAVDLLFSDQFSCKGENNLHPSSVFDGYLLPPVYRDDLIKNDEFKDERFLSFVGVIPAAVANAPDLQFNTLLIQNGNLCRYSFPVEVLSDLIEDVSIAPQWCEEQGTIKTGKAAFVKEFEIPFERNETNADSFYFEKLDRLIDVFGTSIHHIEITAYSSVEGKEAINLSLQTQRAAFLEKYISERLQKKVPIAKKAEENWNLFYEQVKGTPYARDFQGMTTEQIRTAVNSSESAVIQHWLDLQRHSTIRIYVEKEYNQWSPAGDMPLVLYDALQRNDTSQARIAYTKIIKAVERNEIRKYYLTAVEVPLKEAYLPLISNYLASIIVESDVFNYSHFSSGYFDYIDSAQRRFPDFVPLLFNLEIFKMHCYLRGLAYNERQTNEETFRRISAGLLKLKQTGLIDTAVMNAAFYNYYLTAAVYYRNIYRYKEMGESFDKLKPYLPLSKLNAADVFTIGKFFNYFYRLDMTIDLLERYEKIYPDDKDLIYLYVSSGALFMMDESSRSKKYYEKLDQFSKYDKSRFCEWINSNYQLLRYEKMKALACGVCGRK